MKRLNVKKSFQRWGLSQYKNDACKDNCAVNCYLSLIAIVLLGINLIMSAALASGPGASTHARSVSHGDPRGSRGFFDTWGMLEPALVGLDDPDQKTIYASYKQYTCRFTVVDFNAFSNVSSVKINVVDENKIYTWHRTRAINSNRSAVYDDSAAQPRSASRDDYSAGFYKISPDTGYLDFNITFSWSGVSTSGVHDWDITIVDSNTNQSKTTRQMQYNLVRDVKFLGKLQATGEHQGKLGANDWARSLENITWSGVRVVYNTPTSITPPSSEFKITLYDDDGDSWEDQSNPGEEMMIISQTDFITDKSDEHILNLSGPAEDNLIKVLSFNLRVDGDGVHFFNATPQNSTWLSGNPVKCSISVGDNLTSGVDAETIEFSFSKNGGKNWQGWYKPTYIVNDDIIDCFQLVDFPEGTENLIKWRGKDQVANDFSYSQIFEIFLDTVAIVFKNPKPIADEFQYSLSVNCSIVISDETSGVNASSIQYSMLLPGEQNWTSWASAGIIENKNTITIKKKVQFNYGENNYIKWRAKDVAGNGYTVSKQYQIKITHKVPSLFLISPGKGDILNTTTPTFTWEDSYEIVQPVIYTLEYWQEPVNLSTIPPADRIQKKTMDKYYSLDVPLEYSTKYLWQVIPRIQGEDEPGICESGIQYFWVGTFASIHAVYEFDSVRRSPKTVEVLRGENKNIEITIFNTGNQFDTYDLELMVDPGLEGYVNISKNVTVQVNTEKTVVLAIQVPTGIDYDSYAIRLKITSLGAKSKNQTAVEILDLNLKVVKEKSAPPLKLEDVLVYLAIVIIIVIVLVVALVVKNVLKYRSYVNKAKAGIDTTKIAEVEFSPEHKKAVDLRRKGRGRS